LIASKRLALFKNDEAALIPMEMAFSNQTCTSIMF
jgi:hypothetical protein